MCPAPRGVVVGGVVTREEEIGRMRRGLAEFEIGGVPTTIPFHLHVLDNGFFRKGEVYTNFVQRRIDLSAL